MGSLSCCFSMYGLFFFEVNVICIQIVLDLVEKKGDCRLAFAQAMFVFSPRRDLILLRCASKH